jgi:hypothetical protein
MTSSRHGREGLCRDDGDKLLAAAIQAPAQAQRSRPMPSISGVAGTGTEPAVARRW